MEKFEDTFVGALDEMLRDEISAAMQVDKAAIADMVDRLTLKVCDAFGGQQPYIAIGRQFRLNRIYHAIYDAFDGGNFRALAVRYGVTERHIRNVVEGVRKVRREAWGNDPPLIGAEDRTSHAGGEAAPDEPALNGNEEVQCTESKR